MLVHIKDTKLIKDTNTGAILNTDSNDKRKKLALKEKQKSKDKRIDDLENKINNLIELINNLNNNSLKLNKSN